MATARWIVLAIGATGGLEWEVDALAREGHLARTVFVVPPLAAEEVEVRWTATRHALDHAHGRLFVAPVHVAGTVTIRVDARTGEVSATPRRSPRRGRLSGGDRARVVVAPGHVSADVGSGPDRHVVRPSSQPGQCGDDGGEGGAPGVVQLDEITQVAEVVENASALGPGRPGGERTLVLGAPALATARWRCSSSVAPSTSVTAASPG